MPPSSESNNNHIINLAVEAEADADSDDEKNYIDPNSQAGHEVIESSIKDVDGVFAEVRIYGGGRMCRAGGLYGETLC